MTRRDRETWSLRSTPARLRAVPQPVRRRPADATDAALLVRVADRDREAFELLYRRYVRSVFGLALRRLATAAARRTRSRRPSPPVWRSAASYGRARPGGAWLYAVARNAIVDACARAPSRLPSRPDARVDRGRPRRAGRAV